MGAGFSQFKICLKVMEEGFHELTKCLQRKGLGTVEYGVPRLTIIFLSRSITENDASLGPWGRVQPPFSLLYFNRAIAQGCLGSKTSDYLECNIFYRNLR